MEKNCWSAQWVNVINDSSTCFLYKILYIYILHVYMYTCIKYLVASIYIFIFVSNLTNIIVMVELHCTFSEISEFRYIARQASVSDYFRAFLSIPSLFSSPFPLIGIYLVAKSEICRVFACVPLTHCTRPGKLFSATRDAWLIDISRHQPLFNRSNRQSMKEKEKKRKKRPSSPLFVSVSEHFQAIPAFPRPFFNAF